VTLSLALVPGLSGAIGQSAIVVFFTLLLAFLISRILHRYRDIDIFWPLGFVAVAVSGFVASSGQPGAQSFGRVALLVMVGAWGLRLASHLYWRGRGQPDDPRYVALMAGAKIELLRALTMIYGLQAVLMFLVSLTVTVGMFASHPVIVLQIIGIALWVIGFGFEAIGDAQLTKFLADPANQGRVMDKGLWAWTRHPNYFGDAVLWWGIFFVAAANGWGWLTVMSPIIMTILLTRVSGKPLLEGRMKKTRPGYREYIESTSSFLPRPPRKR
jgi:steroid 5-alpha reductase family enzyme